MTVSTELSHEEYVGNGVTTDFDFRFRIFEGKHLIVVVADSDGNETTLKNGTDYTIVGAGSYHGGKVVLNKPLAQGWKILLERDLPVVQETDLRNQGKFFAEVHEDAFDYLTMLIQKALGTFSLSLRKPTYLSNYYDAKGNRIANLAPPRVGGDATNKDYVDNSIKDIDSKTLRVKDRAILALPNIEERSGKVLTFDEDGNPLTIAPASGSAVDVLNILGSIDGVSAIGNSNYDKLRNYTGDKDTVFVTGRINKYDGGEGIFFCDNLDSYSIDNDGTIIVDIKGRRWKRKFISSIRAEWFGVSGNVDDTIYIKNAINESDRINVPLLYKGKIKISEKIDIRCVIDKSSEMCFIPIKPNWNGSYVVKNSKRNTIIYGVQVINDLDLEFNNKYLVGFWASVPEVSYIGLVVKKFPINIQCTSYSNRFTDCLSRLGKTNFSAYGKDFNNEINCLYVDGGDYTDAEEYNIIIGDTRFETDITDSEYMGLDIRVIGVRLDQGSIKIDRVINVEIKCYFERAVKFEPVNIAIEIGGNKPNTRLKNYHIHGCIVRRYNYFLKLNQKVDCLSVVNNSYSNVFISALYMIDIGDKLIYKNNAYFGVNFTKGQEVHTGVPSDIVGYNLFSNATIDIHYLFNGIQNKVKNSENSNQPEFITSSQTIILTDLSSKYYNLYYKSIMRSRIDSDLKVHVDILEVDKISIPMDTISIFNGGDQILIGDEHNYIKSVNYEDGYINLGKKTKISGYNFISFIKSLPLVTGSDYEKPTITARNGSFIYNSSNENKLIGWLYFNNEWNER